MDKLEKPDPSPAKGGRRMIFSRFCNGLIYKGSDEEKEGKV
jgi:hypothetical protein